ncbi:hypothetical protein [Kribbella swartbergensis]
MQQGAEDFDVALGKLGAPFDITLEEVAVETYLPADRRTAESFRR